MADFYMHVLLAEDILKTSQLKLNPSLVKMGAQGPDPFYFNVFNNHKIKSSKLADDMHDFKINDMLIAMLEYVKTHYSLELHAFYMGFLSHYALDTILHPYIFHHSGNYQISDHKSHSHRGLHVKFERRVDIHFIRHLIHQEVHQYPVCKLVFDQESVPNEVIDLMGYVTKSIYHVDLGGKFYALGYENMKQTCKRFVQDRFGLKKKLLSLFDLFNKTQAIFFKDLSYHNYDEKFDYLNLSHQIWYHPVTKEPSTLSVLELYVKAYYRAMELVEETSKYLLNNQTVDFEKLFGNLSFNSGVDCDLKLNMRHFNLFNDKKSFSHH